ncbi:hypothetical protein FNV43_RR01919 [Rhamnella rubrinervis]|uniref:SAC3/GANP/THP3 conserved domain-containing protein n=1 Tax=Rhamnella rubrinervis TaxID=2594499 RepID=A0A8K0HQH9_9ROSA|nr:hypothetical protein FNV43_RR01919 [Rhamnella rubrinervis]
MRGFGDHTGPLPKPVDSPLVFGNPARPSTPTPPFSDAAPPRSPSSIESVPLNAVMGKDLTLKVMMPKVLKVLRSNLLIPIILPQQPDFPVKLFPPSALTPDLASKNNHPVHGFRPWLKIYLMGPRSNFIFSIRDSQASQREIEAKAKRLARFKVELGETRQSCIDVAEHIANRNGQSVLERDKITPDHSMESAAEINNTSALFEYEGLESSGIIIGFVQICVQSLKGQKEREKGTLINMNVLMEIEIKPANTSLLKRTAEGEANLIRPMPILQMTVDYLLNLLDQPYSDRLHIIAMHELCEYPKGEGFYEGFDAHLNIEQMNKTSVELFQLYDDHRKKGIHIPTEKEFRGYYALLKLDKHPGYTVEPAEFSLDLAKMTPQIRLTSEVMFARKVSRACGIGNYISFFRLARKASYLQACLSTLTLQSYGRKHLPFCMLVSRITRESLLPMLEEEDLESLLEYHGFLIKVFNEPYMVKEGPFLNFDKEYPTRRSKLVDLKRSGRIMEDVLPSTQVISMPLKAPKETQMGKNDPKSVPPVERESSSCDIPAIEVDGAAHALDEEMPDSQAAASQKESIQIQPTFETPVVYQQSKDNHQMAGILSLPWGSSSVRVDSPGIPKDDAIFGKTLHSGTGTETKITLKPHAEEEPRVYKNVENSVPQIMLNQLEDEVPPDLLRENDNDDLMENDQQEETAEAKLKLIIRLWKRRSSKQRELREQRQVAANAALQSLSIGPPIYLQKDQPSVSGEFDIGQFLTERCKKREQSRSILNVSGEILGMLSRKNPDARWLCWKLVICSHLNNPEEDKLGQMNFAAGSWLLSKLMPSSKTDYDAGLVISSAGLSIWKKCVPNQSVLDLTCCWSIVKDANFNNLTETVWCKCCFVHYF